MPHSFIRRALALGVVSLLITVSAGHSQSLIREEIIDDQIIYFSKSSPDKEVWDLQWNQHYALADSVVIYRYLPYDDCDGFFEGKILSIAGSILSYHQISGYDCAGAAHPSISEGFETVNLETGRTVSLLDLFDEDDIFRALLADRIIQKSLRGEMPDGLEQLFSLADGGCDVYIGKYMLSSFAFHHADSNRVAIRVGLTAGCEYTEEKLTQIGFYLPLAGEMKEKIMNAARSGTLMNEMSKLEYVRKEDETQN